LICAENAFTHKFRMIMNPTFTFYKYTPHIEQFLKKPMLRATPAYALNDPFELKIDRHNAEILGNDQYFTAYQLTRTGVISLCETKDNLQMWSHYADEHRGGVIEFTFELKTYNQNIKTTNFFINVAANNFKFDSVKYCDSRELEPNDYEMPSYEKKEQLKKHLSFIKAKSWGNEKEHRFVCELTSANSVSLQRPSSDKKLDALKDKLNELKISYLDNADNILLPNFCKKSDGMHYNMNYPIIEEYCRANDISLFHFFDIDPATVTGIYLGCDSPLERPLAKSETVKFTNLKANVQKAKLSDERYEIVFKALS